LARPPRGPRFSECAAALVLTLLSSPALAQVSGNFALLSDYRFRGISLTSGKPAAQLSATYDDPRGWYAGGAVSAVLASCWQDCGGLQSIVYAGYATQHASGVAWDAGGDFRFSAARNDYRFGEAHLGVSYRDTSARLYYAPDYFGQSISAVYAELNQALPLGSRARLLGHIGWLQTGSGRYGAPSETRADVLLGGSIDVESFELQLTWQHAAARGTAYPAYPNERRNAWVFVVSRAF
jgi:uncharacterized protein (TIGR02001 family)